MDGLSSETMFRIRYFFLTGPDLDRTQKPKADPDSGGKGKIKGFFCLASAAVLASLVRGARTGLHLKADSTAQKAIQVRLGCLKSFYWPI